MRKFIDLIESLIVEAPISDIQVHGNLDEPGSFNRYDRELIKRNIIQGTYVEKLKNLPFDLNIFILNNIELEKIARELDKKNQYYMGKVIWQRPPYILSDDGRRHDASFLEPLRNEIEKKSLYDVNLILGGNFASGGGRVPMSPWIVVHRLLHTIDYNIFDVVKYDESLENYSSANKNRIVPYRPENDDKISWWDVPMMKSIQDPEMDNENELFLEMGVEYLIYGRIRINYDKLKIKCDKLGCNYQVIGRIVNSTLDNFKKAMDEAMNNIKGTTRYI